MNRHATYLWAWLAVMAQVFIGVVPAHAAGRIVPPAARECCSGEATPSCCEGTSKSEACSDCACCADLPTNRETPTPTEPTRHQPPKFAIWHAATAQVASAPGGGIQGHRAATTLLGQSRERTGFLESRLRV